MKPVDGVACRHVWRLELAGIAFIFLVGSLLHFVFEWTGCWRPVAAVAPVNESVWEHFKLAFFPGLLFGGIEYSIFGRSLPNFWFAKLVGLCCMPLVIGLGFYGYTAGLGLKSSLIPNILLLLIGIVAGQLASYRLMLVQRTKWGTRALALAGLAFMTLLFVLFSYAAPRFFLFEDTAAHQYGILGLCDE